MNRVMRAFQRDITFMVFEKTIQFRIPIHTVRGDEFFLNCSVPKDGVPVLTYEVVKTPMSLTIEVPPADATDTSHSSPRSVPSPSLS